MLLKTTKEKCFDFKYDKFLKDMRSTDWNSSASEGGMFSIYPAGFLSAF